MLEKKYNILNLYLALCFLKNDIIVHMLLQCVISALQKFPTVSFIKL